MATHTSPKTERGCGYRTRAGIYSICGGSPFGRPLEHFLCDPPLRVDPETLGLTDVGVKILPDADGVYHIWDIVGQESYWNVADFVEEMKYFLSIGREAMSRKLPKNLEFSKLEWGKSRHILLHRHAYIENFEELYAALYVREAPRCPDLDEEPVSIWPCPKQRETHQLTWEDDEFKPGLVGQMEPVYPPEMCAGLWWQDVVGPNTDLIGLRYMPSFSYKASPPPIETEHELAIFARMPITSLAVIRDDRRQGVVNALIERLTEECEIPVDLENV